VVLGELPEVAAAEAGMLRGPREVVAVALVDGREVAPLEARQPLLLGLLELEAGVDHLGRSRRGLEPEAELAELGPRGAGEHPRPLEDVAELAHVAGPGVLGEPGQVLAVDRPWIDPAALVEVADQRRQVLEAIAQRRDRDVHDRDAVEEIEAEALGVDHRRQVAVAGHDHPRVEGQRTVGAEGLHRARLERAQQPRLRGERQLAELVEEQRTAVGLEARSLARCQRAGERARPVAEELRLDQLLAGGAAVDHHERAGGARRVVVQRARRELLAGPRLPLDQDRRVAGGGELEDGEELAQQQALADQPAEAAARARLDRRRRRPHDLQRGPAAAKRGARRDRRLGHARRLEEGAVGAAEVTEVEPVGAQRELDVTARDLGVGEDQVAAGIGADDHRSRAERDLEPPVGAHHAAEEQARRGAVARERGGDPGLGDGVAGLHRGQVTTARCGWNPEVPPCGSAAARAEPRGTADRDLSSNIERHG
jgi:hypothetical protein